MTEVKTRLPDAAGHFGVFGGRYVPETLMPALEELTEAFESAQRDPDFRAEVDSLARDWVGRPSPIYFARQLSDEIGGGS